MSAGLPLADNDGRLPTRGHALMHVLAVAAGWLLFVWFWYDVTRRPSDIADILRLLIGTAILLPVITLSWVLHNLGIYKRRGPRRGLRGVALTYERDFNGRPVQADWSALRSAAFIAIELAPDGKKCYSAPRHEFHGREAATRVPQ